MQLFLFFQPLLLESSHSLFNTVGIKNVKISFDDLVFNFRKSSLEKRSNFLLL